MERKASDFDGTNLTGAHPIAGDWLAGGATFAPPARTRSPFWTGRAAAIRSFFCQALWSPAPDATGWPQPNGCLPARVLRPFAANRDTLCENSGDVKNAPAASAGRGARDGRLPFTLFRYQRGRTTPDPHRRRRLRPAYDRTRRPRLPFAGPAASSGGSSPPGPEPTLPC